jgi:hypoxanthine-guanine phosphoribosyltransferase
MSGGVPFAGHLMTQLHFPLDFDYLHVTRYGQETSGGALVLACCAVDAGQGPHGHHSRRHPR